MDAPARTIDRGESTWSVHEVDARDVPGTRGSSCLIFESPEAVRRAWVFPAHWRELDDDSLWLVGERAPRLAAALEARKVELTSAIQRSMRDLYTAQVLVKRAQEVASENIEARLQLADLLRSCRSERQALHEAVAVQASRLRDAGVNVDDAGRSSRARCRRPASK